MIFNCGTRIEIYEHPLFVSYDSKCYRKNILHNGEESEINLYKNVSKSKA